MDRNARRLVLVIADGRMARMATDIMTQMNSGAQCDECRRLLDVASDAITQQLRAIARLDLARLHHEVDRIPALETVAHETRVVRERAVAVFRKHREQHASGASGESAMAQAN